MNTSVCKEEVYNGIYMEQSESLRNFMYYKTGDLKQAEDLMHEAFIKLWENCSNVIFEKAKSFIFTVANNLFINHIRHHKIVLDFEKSHAGNAFSEDPSYALQYDEFRSKLEKAIADLTESQREVFLMSRIDNMKYREISETLNISVKAVEKRIHNALVALKGKISELEDHKI